MTIRPLESGRDEPALICPRDGATMRRFDFAGVVVDRCIRCGGIWLDLGELRQLLEAPVDARERLSDFDGGHGLDDTSSATGGGACPRDTMILTRVRDARQRHIEYDLCMHCGGVFFDTGELADLSRFTLAERIRWIFPGLHQDPETA